MSVFVDIEKSYGDFHLKVSFSGGNETLALLGASGSGKSLTLKCIAGLERPDRGRIVVNDRVLFDSELRIDLPPQKRHTALLFQNYALFPHMTVLQNVLAGARREQDKKLRFRRAEELLERFGLKQFAERLPHSLSGGQQQRVALARSLVSDPEILLLDEPFSALDSYLRQSMEQEVRQVIRFFGKPVILVSHDRNEVYRMSDSVTVLYGGSVAETGCKESIYLKPQSIHTAQLVGVENIFQCTPKCCGALGINLSEACSPSYIGIRSEDLLQSAEGKPCSVVERIEEPDKINYLLQTEEGIDFLWKRQKSETLYEVSQCVKIAFPREKLLFLQGASEKETI